MALLNLNPLLNSLIGQNPPTTQADQSSTLEDNAVFIDVLANDAPGQQGLVNSLLSTSLGLVSSLLSGGTAPSSPQLSLKSVSVPAGMGTAVIDNNRIKFTPPANFHGQVTLSYVATDGRSDSAPTSVTVQVTPVNDAPVGVADSASTAAATLVSIDVLANDTDVDNASPAAANAGLSIKAGSIVVDPAQGSAAIRQGKIDFTPAAGFSGNATLTYVATDGQADSQPTKVTVAVAAPVNAAPTAVALTGTTPTLAENTSTAARIEVGTIAITDDGRGTNTVTLGGADAASFEVLGNKLYVKAGTVLDFETQKSYAVTVNVADNSVAGSTPVSTHYTLAVGNADEVAPAFTSAKTASAIENQNLLYTAAATDTDFNAPATAASVTYRLQSGLQDDAALLAIAADGKVTLASGNLDVDAVNAKKTYAFTVVASDAAGNAREQAVSVNVTNDPSDDPIAGPSFTRISAIQGSGETSPLLNQTVTVQARVTAWKPDLKMFFIEEEQADRDGNDATSEGIAVFYGTAASPVTVDSIGDIVQFTATVVEFKATGDTSPGTLTELSNITGFQMVKDGSAADLDPATQVTLPVATSTTLERYEGMRVEISAASGKDLFVGDTYTFARYGETTLYADAVPLTYTEFNAPSAAGNAAYQDFLSRNSIQLEDGNTVQNPTLAKLNSGSMILRDATQDGVANPTAMGVQADNSVNFIRAGDHTRSVTGVLSYSFGTYELQPTANVNLVAAPRPTGSPDVGATEVKVASFNVLNYFTTLGTTSFTNPSGTTHAGRGANNATEFTQQQAKIVEAMLATGAHVFGINELQNNGDGASSAIASLVNALNAKVGSAKFAYASGHATGDDAIRVGILYDTTVVKPVGAAATPNTATYSAFAAANRLPVAQSFSYLNDDTKQFTVVVNHFKSKGSAAGLPGDTDQGDGQGMSAATRLAAAQDLNAWLNTNPTGKGDGNVVLTGDLNAYSAETPVTYLTSQGFVEAANPGDYSYVFDGLRGSLDHVLTRGIDSAEITGTAHFHINADEQIALDYNDEFGDGSVSVAMDRNDMYRSSDHDPVVIGLKLASASSTPAPAPSPAPAPAPTPAPSPAPTPAPAPAPTPAPAPSQPLPLSFTQNFDSLANTGTSSTLPADWFISETGTAANASYTAGTGSSNTGDTYSFGATGSTDRALGSVQSGSVVASFGAVFTNSSAQTVTQANIAYTGEQWRLGTSGRADRLDFQYSTDATSLTTGTWTDVDALDFIAPTTTGTAGLLDGNLQSTLVSASISGLTLASGQTLWIRWKDFNASGADDGLAVDDFSITLVGMAA